MIKLVVLQRRKAGLTREEFRDYYENKHAPLAQRLIPYMAVYKRNYPTDESFVRDGSPAPEPDFDVITEVIYNSREDMQKGYAAILNSPEADLLDADERNFVDQSSIRCYVVEEYTSS